MSMSALQSAESRHTSGGDAAELRSASSIHSDTPIECDSSPSSIADNGSTISVTSSVWRFHKENGRTYHGYRSGIYFYPNDLSEIERLEFQHGFLGYALQDKLHFAPLSSPSTILDIGTGTGAWAVEMGDAYPDAIIEATDLSPIQPEDVPINVRFIIDDAEHEDWIVPENHYDYIHTRILMGCFEDFSAIVKRGFRYTKPGGWMESQDLMHPPYCDDGTMPADWPFKEWSESIEDASIAAGRPLRMANKLKKWYIEAGFVDVQEKIIKLPINSWPRDEKLKNLGNWWAENLLAGLQGFSLALLSRVYGWNKTEIEVYLVNVRKSITDHRVHAYHRFYVVCGRKPEISESKSDKPDLPNSVPLAQESTASSSSSTPSTIQPIPPPPQDMPQQQARGHTGPLASL